jgi:hypothetical protein
VLLLDQGGQGEAWQLATKTNEILATVTGGFDDTNKPGNCHHSVEALARNF